MRIVVDLGCARGLGDVALGGVGRSEVLNWMVEFNKEV